MEKTNKHHVYPSSRVNGTDLVGVCLDSKKQKKLYYQLIEGERDILKLFNYFNKNFWGKIFIIEHIFQTRREDNIEKLIVSQKKRKNTLRPLICKVDKEKHGLYHQLVGNMMPEEVLSFFNQRFWHHLIIIEAKQINGFSFKVKHPIVNNTLQTALK